MNKDAIIQELVTATLRKKHNLLDGTSSPEEIAKDAYRLHGALHAAFKTEEQQLGAQCRSTFEEVWTELTGDQKLPRDPKQLRESVWQGVRNTVNKSMSHYADAEHMRPLVEQALKASL